MPTKQFSRHSRVFALIVAGLLLGCLWPAAARATQLDQLTIAAVNIVQAKMQTQREAMDEIGRRGRLRMDELKRWRDFYANGPQYFAEALRVERMLLQFRLSKATYIARYAPGLEVEPNVAFVPFSRTTDIKQMVAQATKVKRDNDAEEAAVEGGSVQFWIIEFGWANKQAMASQVAPWNKKIRELQAQLSGGTFSINYPSLGWVDANSLKTEINRQAAKVDALKQARARGDSGPAQALIGMNRKQSFDIRIAALERELKRIEANFGKKYARINRALFQGENARAQVELVLGAYRKQVRRIEDSLRDGTYRVQFSDGAANGQALKRQIEDKKAQMAKVKDLLNRGLYQVRTSRTGIIDGKRARLILHDRNASGIQKKMASRALTHITLASDVELKVLAAEIDLIKGRLLAIPRLARPELDKMNVRIDNYQQILVEFGVDLEAYQQHYRRKIGALREAAKLYP